jgi:hypothetical protein
MNVVRRELFDRKRDRRSQDFITSFETPSARAPQDDDLPQLQKLSSW